MDSLTQLALFTKATLVFETPGTFLSFPALDPLSYPADELDFTQLANRSTPVYPEFCRLVDAIPRGVLYPGISGTSFSAEYDKVLREAETAQSALTPEETAALQQALAFLYIQQPDGTRADGTALIAYLQYQQAYFTALQAYTSQQSTAEASADPAVQAQWQNVDQPRLSAAVQAAENDWDAKGYKEQVEQAQAVQVACAAKSPQGQWQAWQAAFNPDLDEQTAPDGSTYAVAAYSPFDILGQADWPTFTLSGPEIELLANEAPEELKSIFQTDAEGSPSVSSLSFEFCAVTVNRPWCHPDLFGARFWRFSDPSELLSDGGTPPQGECPAYITGLVFARNIVVTDAGGTPGPPKPRPLPVFPPILLRRPVPVAPPILVKPEPVAAVQAALPVISMVTPGRLNLGTFKALPVSPVLSPPAPSGAEPPPAPAGGQPHSADVSFLAFICAPLPRCPDWNPGLTWLPHRERGLLCERPPYGLLLALGYHALVQLPALQPFPGRRERGRRGSDHEDHQLISIEARARHCLGDDTSQPTGGHHENRG